MFEADAQEATAYIVLAGFAPVVVITLSMGSHAYESARTESLASYSSTSTSNLPPASALSMYPSCQPQLAETGFFLSRPVAVSMPASAWYRALVETASPVDSSTPVEKSEAKTMPRVVNTARISMTETTEAPLSFGLRLIGSPSGGRSLLCR